MFRNILVLLIFMSIGSFIGYFLGINYVRDINNQMINVNLTGLFGGLFIHSMILGPLSVLVALVFINIYMECNKKIFIILFFIATVTVLLSASRGATLALVISIVYILFFKKDDRGKKKKLIFLLVISLIIFIPVSRKFTAGLLEKQESNVAAGSTFNSREDKWGNRIREFKENPVIGIGFSAVSLKSIGDYHSKGGIEPGSSHLAVLSMTGLCGFLAYFMVLWSAFQAVKNDCSTIARLRLCMFIAFIIHAAFEGYALSAGGFLFLMYWLIIGQCEDYRNLIRYNLLQKNNKSVLYSCTYD